MISACVCQARSRDLSGSSTHPMSVGFCQGSRPDTQVLAAYSEGVLCKVKDRVAAPRESNWKEDARYSQEKIWFGHHLQSQAKAAQLHT